MDGILENYSIQKVDLKYFIDEWMYLQLCPITHICLQLDISIIQ